jgi:ATP-dependent Clp protease ATP-binding subunit ClpA
MCGVIDLYKYGIRDNPWNDPDLTVKFKRAETDFEKRVKGQKAAIVKSLDIVKRAVTGMSGIQHSSHGKPRGILFFAGPTGTGKTETAKTLAETIFGDENRCIRFDMSEYSQSHSDQKLLGAPPGYIGYDAGGQLTNAVKANPFSILLFDEIEKAHPSIFDKFLQILEDGRMTDGQGNTVYFSETIIIFTSNLGIYTKDSDGQRQENVSREMSYAETQSKVKSAIEDYFKLELGRPEILNRIGENIVVFDFIRPETAKLILDSQLNKITLSLASEKNINISLSDESRETLLNSATGNLQNGGRGIGNIVESQFVNPLSRYMFDNNILNNADLTIESININDDPITITCGKDV